MFLVNFTRSWLWLALVFVTVVACSRQKEIVVPTVMSWSTVPPTVTSTPTPEAIGLLVEYPSPSPENTQAIEVSATPISTEIASVDEALNPELEDYQLWVVKDDEVTLYECTSLDCPILQTIPVGEIIRIKPFAADWYEVYLQGDQKGFAIILMSAESEVPSNDGQEIAEAQPLEPPVAEANPEIQSNPSVNNNPPLVSSNPAPIVAQPNTAPSNGSSGFIPAPSANNGGNPPPNDGNSSPPPDNNPPDDGNTNNPPPDNNPPDDGSTNNPPPDNNPPDDGNTNNPPPVIDPVLDAQIRDQLMNSDPPPDSLVDDVVVPVDENGEEIILIPSDDMGETPAGSDELPTLPEIDLEADIPPDADLPEEPPEVVIDENDLPPDWDILIDTDEDGLTDDIDRCPLDVGELDGCPDADGDSIPDNIDICPDLAVHDFINDPCNFDEDADGVPDAEDQCVADAGTYNGCPDIDGDGIPDNGDICPADPIHDLVGDACNHDEDNDTFADDLDLCPLEAGTLNGCPDETALCEDGSPYDLVGDACNHDEDNDSFTDDLDLCPLVVGTLNGCPEDSTLCEDGSPHDLVGDVCNHDEDGDTFTDDLDLCPLVVGTVNGCPEDTALCEDGSPHDLVGDTCNHDEDADTFTDELDLCPLIVGTLNGCPDMDSDGIPDSIDVCPNDAVHDLIGDVCNHDEDGDTFTDDLDLCPLVVGTANGCPDADSDGIPDSTDVCPNDAVHDLIGDACNHDEDADTFLDGIDLCPLVMGTLDGCPDTDSDGIPDLADVCPNDAVHDLVGDPCNHDEDADTFLDGVDLCPALFGTVNGCPDTDSDGIPDTADACPNDAIHDLVGDPCNHDEDADTFLDELDLCPLVVGTVNGCPDANGDGIAD